MAKGYVSIDLSTLEAEVWVEESTGPTRMDAGECMALATELMQAAQALTALLNNSNATAKAVQAEVDRVAAVRPTPRARAGR